MDDFEPDENEKKADRELSQHTRGFSLEKAAAALAFKEDMLAGKSNAPI
jgi:hypothetical protein